MIGRAEPQAPRQMQAGGLRPQGQAASGLTPEVQPLSREALPQFTFQLYIGVGTLDAF